MKRICVAITVLVSSIGFTGATAEAAPFQAETPASGVYPGPSAVSGSDPDTYSSMRIRLRGNTVIVEITRPGIRTIAQLRARTVDIALPLIRDNADLSAVEVFSSAPGSPNGVTRIRTSDITAYRKGRIKRAELIKRISVSIPRPRSGRRQRWDA